MAADEFSIAQVVAFEKQELLKSVEIIIVCEKGVNWSNKKEYKAISQSDSGLYNAINCGINVATQKHVVVIGDDDHITVTKHLIDFLYVNSSQIVISDVQSQNQTLRNHFSMYRSLLKNNHHHQGYFVPLLVYNTKMYDEKFIVAGDFELITYLISEDTSFIKYNKIVCRHDYRRLSDSTKILGYLEDVRVYNRYYGFLSSVGLVAAFARYVRKIILSSLKKIKSF